MGFCVFPCGDISSASITQSGVCVCSLRLIFTLCDWEENSIFDTLEWSIVRQKLHNRLIDGHVK